MYICTSLVAPHFFLQIPPKFGIVLGKKNLTSFLLGRCMCIGVLGLILLMRLLSRITHDVIHGLSLLLVTRDTTYGVVLVV